MGILEGCDGETKGRGEWLSELECTIKDGVEGQELGARNRMGDNRLNKGHLDVREVGLGEDLLNPTCSCNSVPINKGVGNHTNGEDKRTEGFALPLIGIRKRVDARPCYLVESRYS